MKQDEIRQAVEEDLFDCSILRHGFTPYMRDYELVVRSLDERERTFRFTHCVVASVTTAVGDAVWKESWDDRFIDYGAWENSGEPEGHVWGVCWFCAYPGATYMTDSVLAQEWSQRLGKTMHEVQIETNGHNLRLVFHDLKVSESSVSS